METVNDKAIYQDARQYLNVVKALYKKKKFNNKTLASIACIAAEQFMVSYLASKSYLPRHHSLNSLIDECAERHKDLPLSIINDVYFLEEFQSLCAIENIGMKVPEDKDMDRIINTLTGLDVTLFP